VTVDVKGWQGCVVSPTSCGEFGVLCRAGNKKEEPNAFECDERMMGPLAQTDWEKGNNGHGPAFDAPAWPDKRGVCLSCRCDFWIVMV